MMLSDCSDANPGFKVHVKLRALNPFIVCPLCAGYFVDATTIKDCLHTFCKSCIVKYLQESKQCPSCNQLVHETEPLSRIKLDRTLQDIVHKLVPRVPEDEESRRQAFYQERKRSLLLTEGPSAKSTDRRESISPCEDYDFLDVETNFDEDEQINLVLNLDPRQGRFGDFPIQELGQKYVRCSVRNRVWQLKKLLRSLHSAPHGCKVFVACNGGELPDRAPLKFAVLAWWRSRVQPIAINYWFVLDQAMDDRMSLGGEEGRGDGSK